MNIDIDKWAEAAIAYGLRIVLAMAIMAGGWIIAKFVKGIARRSLHGAYMDQTLVNFLVNVAYALILTFVFIAALNQLGIQTASLVAVVGAAGLAIGLALQGSLSNFAAGLMIIIFKHFRVGDTIEAAGVTGTVENLDIFSTTLITGNNQVVIIPNAKLTQDVITNFSVLDTRREEITVSIGYKEDAVKAQRVLREAVEGNPYVLKEKDIVVAMNEHGTTGINFVVRCWSLNKDFWNMHVRLMEDIKRRFDEEGIAFPHAQTDIHIIRGER